VPVILPVLVVIALSSLTNDNHNIRYLKGAKPSPGPLLEDQFSGWYSNLCATFPTEAPHPVILVATAGGGIRAAFWTGTVLGELQDRNPNFAAHVFAISGVSGGSLGAAVFDAMLKKGGVQSYKQSAQGVLSHDFLSPALAYMLFPDMVQRFVPVPIRRFDRARALEKGWEKGWEKTMGDRLFGMDFKSLWQDNSAWSIPSLFLNGTSVETGNRMISSNVQIDAGFIDCEDVDHLLAAPIALSTAVHMSARFTYVSPAGRFPNGEHIVDGGYVENSGAATVSDVLDGIEATTVRPGGFVPVVIVISNDPLESTDTQAQLKSSEFLSEPLAPVEALLQARQARASYSVMDLRFRPDCTNFFEFSLTQAKAPLPLGWSLSQSATAEMNRLLDAQSNVCAQVLNFLPKK
jgi:predicted acylesterase/phospholipase RssA